MTQDTLYIEAIDWLSRNSTATASNRQFSKNPKTGLADIEIGARLLHNVERIPKPMIDTVYGPFKCSLGLKSLDNMPRLVDSFWCNSMYIKTFENIPASPILDLHGSGIRNIKDLLPHLKAYTGQINISCCAGLKSLVGIDEIAIPHGVHSLYISCAYVERGGIGLLLIPGLTSLKFGTQIGSQRSAFNDVIDTFRKPNGYDAFCVIEKYVGRPEDIFECQAELIEAGLADYAIL